ncbi:Leucine-rich repeat-containing protein 37A2 [Heterocephalus glaber]|uniref:Leucine-rich repeat-containing protein 37A2 n=1 Tax=Heterocephalus glaber TaxID=10181 RepID=G5AXL5_HETGA|nr:Leucine-rich repeat-containing protein 37A2 [Heterocephalus glaber]
MFLRCPWVPALLIWQQLSFLVLAAPLSERHWVPLTTKPELSAEPWLPNLLPELPDALTPQLQPEGFDDLESSAPSLELSPILGSSEQIELSQVQPEAQTRNHKPAKVQSSLPLQEVKDQLSQPPEEAEPSVTQQAPRAQYELGTEEHTGQLSMHQEANAPSGSRSEAHHSNMAFVTVRPVDMKVTTSAEAGKKPQPTSSQLQTLTQPTESPEEEEPSSTQQQILAQTLELSEETETPSTYQEAPAQPLGPLGESELSATKTKPAQLSESSRTEEPSEIQLKAPDQPSDWETEELETSPTQLKQPAQFSEHGKERVPTPHHHKAKHPHLPHVTGKPLNLQLITPEPTTVERIFPVLPTAAAQPSTPMNDVEPSTSQQEAPTIQNEANPQGYMKGNMKNPSHQPVSSSLAYRNELKKLYFLQSWSDAEIQRKLEEVKKKEKTGMLTQSSLSSPKFHIIPDVPEKLASAQAQENWLVEDQHEGRRQQTVDRVLKGPKGIRKRLLEERQKEKVREKQSTQPLAENTADRRSLRSPSTEKPGQNEGVLGPGNPLPTEQKVPMSSALQDPLLRRSATSALPKAPHGARNGPKDLTNSIWVLENASMRVKSMKATKPILGSKNGHDFHTTASLKAHRTLEADPREQLTEEDTRGKLKIAEGPLLAALRSLIHSPSQGFLSSSGDPRVQAHPFPELHDPAKTTTVENQAAGNTPEKNVFATNSLISATDSALTLISTNDHTNERHWEYTSTSSEPPPPETSVPLLSSPGDEFETQLNQQLHVLIPNKEVRRFLWYMIRTFKRDCSEPSMHLACAKLISRTGLLMKLLMLSEQQEEKVVQAQWDTEQWKSETYIKESSGVSSNQKAQGEPRDHTQEVPGHDYNKKLILAILVTGTSMLLIIILCLIKICSHRTASGKDEKGSSNSVCRRRRKYSRKKDSQEGFSRFRLPLWLRDLSRPLSVTQHQSMVQKLYDKYSLEEDESVLFWHYITFVPFSPAPL